MPATNELLQEGRYRISQRTPGNENVFEAYDTVRNTNVVVREIPVKLNKVTTVSQRESLKLAFANHAKALTEIDHESLLHVHDFFSEIDRQYLVMEMVDGEDLASVISRNRKPFSVAEVMAWADQLLDALNHIHAHKPSIIHRNIRPQNLKLDGSGKIKLLGVGLENGADSDLTLDDDGSNLRYSPIEQIWPGLDPASQKAITNSYDDRSERILKEPLDARSDIYSLGATLYFLITGQEPVDPLERSIDVLEGKLDPLSEPIKVDPRIPADISDVLMKALEIKRENRYDSALIMRQVMKTALTRIAEREEESREPASNASVSRVAEPPKADTAAVDAEQKKLDAEVEKRRQEELLQQQAREAEDQRVLAEKREAEAQRLLAEQREREAKQLLAEQQKAAETERLLAEQRAEVERLAREEREEAEREEARRAEEKANRALESVLEIPAPAEVMAYRDVADPDEDELAAVLEELAAAEAEAVEVDRSKRDAEQADLGHAPAATDDVQVIESPVDMSSLPPSTPATDDDDDIFSLPEKSGFSLPIPAIAAAVGLVVMIAVGGWFAMSGSSEPEKAAPVVQPVQVSQPAVDSNTAAVPVESTQTESEPVPSISEGATDQPVAVAKAAPSPAKSKKADPAKAPEKKKSVTVDDLINDN